MQRPRTILTTTLMAILAGFAPAGVAVGQSASPGEGLPMVVDVRRAVSAARSPGLDPTRFESLAAGDRMGFVLPRSGA